MGLACRLRGPWRAWLGSLLLGIVLLARLALGAGAGRQPWGILFGVGRWEPYELGILWRRMRGESTPTFAPLPGTGAIRREITAFRLLLSETLQNLIGAFSEPSRWCFMVPS